MIAIDGPAASGKSTTARRVADLLGFSFLNTGSMYRASALAVRRAGLSLERGAEAAAFLQSRTFGFTPGNGILLDGEDVTPLINTAEMGEAASIISALREVRVFLVKLQRLYADGRNTVAEGRDMGTVVFPDAFMKVYVVADAPVRARRRLRDLGGGDMGEMVRQVLRRDRRDRFRPDSPLRVSPGAYWLDGTHMSLAQQVDDVVAEYRRLAGEQ